MLWGQSQVTYQQTSTLRPFLQMTDEGKIVSTWATDGQGLARVNVHTIQPVLQSGTQAVLISGSTVTRYSDVYNRAVRETESGTMSPEAAWGLVGFFAGGSLVSLVQRLGAGYVDRANAQGQHAAVTGTGTVIGRPATIITVSPLSATQTGSGSPAGTGKATIWLDQQYPIVLKLTTSGSPDGLQQWTYRVTSLTPGRLPTPDFLRYRPPVPVHPAPQSATSTDSIDTIPGRTLSAPKGFIRVTAPAGYTLRSRESGSDPLWGKTSSIAGVFQGKGFVDVQEQIRATGLPPQLKTDPAHRAGSCRVWTGLSAGANWLALQRHNVSLLALANKMSQKALIHFAAAHICD
jgi:hypothetical protein